MMYRYSLKIFLVLLLFSCRREVVETKQEFKHYSVKAEGELKSMTDSILLYKMKVDAETGKVIAISEGELRKDGDESTLGNFVCDAIYHCVVKHGGGIKPDVVLANRGGLRNNLPKGEIKVLNVFELMPFENEVVVLKVKGEKLGEVLGHIKKKKHPYWGMKISGFGSAVKNIMIGGNRFDNEKEYLVATSDYLANGGDGFTFLAGGEHLEQFSIKVRDAIIEYCEDLTKEKKNIIPYTDGRLQEAK